MENILSLSVTYYKNQSVEEEMETEVFWLDLKKRIYELTADITLISIKQERRHQSAVVGEHAGIIMSFLVEGIPVIYTYYEIWKAFAEHLTKKKEEGKVARIRNLGTLENLCHFDLIINKGVEGASIISSKLIYDKHKPTDGRDHKLYYDGPVYDEEAAAIVFETKKKQYLYTIMTSGAISSYEVRKK